MILNSKEFLENYSFNSSTSRSEFLNFLSELSNRDGDSFMRFSKNVLALTILKIGVQSLAVNEYPETTSINVASVFKRRKFGKVLRRGADYLGLEKPQLAMNGIASIVTLLSVLLWIVIIIVFLFKHIEIMFSGFELIVIPFSVMIVLAPVGVLKLLFPDFFAGFKIQGVTSFIDLVNLLYTTNLELFNKDGYPCLIKGLILIQSLE